MYLDLTDLLAGFDNFRFSFVQLSFKVDHDRSGMLGPIGASGVVLCHRLGRMAEDEGDSPTVAAHFSEDRPHSVPQTLQGEAGLDPAFFLKLILELVPIGAEAL
ncbi:hypothetical protein [Neorhizobium galegae]|uniref:hypothetical protein n=1 Tax=Neorhizobium galegae TaxID=399 RepID=UPI003CCA2279